MLVSFQQDKNVNFKSIPLQKVKLRSVRSGRPVEAVLLRLNSRDESDQIVMRKVRDGWLSKQETATSNVIIKQMLSVFEHRKASDAFYAIERPGSEPLEQRIIGMMYLDKHEIVYIKAKPKTNITSDEADLKGVGEMLLGKALDVFYRRGREYVPFISAQDNFYYHVFSDKANLQRAKYADYVAADHMDEECHIFKVFTVYRNGMKKFLEYIQREYSTTFEPETKSKGSPLVNFAFHLHRLLTPPALAKSKKVYS